MSRKISIEAVSALWAFRPFCKGNTAVTVSEDGTTAVMVLHGNEIARLAVCPVGWPGSPSGHLPDGRAFTLEIRTAGWPTHTTRERLNALAPRSLRVWQAGDQWVTDGRDEKARRWNQHTRWTTVYGIEAPR